MSTRTGIWALILDPAFWELSGPFRPFHWAGSSTLVLRAGFLVANLCPVSGYPRPPPAASAHLTKGVRLMAATASGTCRTPSRHTVRARGIGSGLRPVAFVLSLLAGSSRSTGGGRKSRAAAVGVRSPLWASPRLSSAPGLAGPPRRGELSQPGVCVHAQAGGLPHGYREGGEGTHGLGFFPLAAGGCPSCRPPLWIRSLFRSGWWSGCFLPGRRHSEATQPS